MKLGVDLPWWTWVSNCTGEKMIKWDQHDKLNTVIRQMTLFDDHGVKPAVEINFDIDIKQVAKYSSWWALLTKQNLLNYPYIWPW